MHLTRQDGLFQIIDPPAELAEGARKVSFGVPIPPGTPHADRAWENFQRLIEPCIRQSAGLEPVPWEHALAEVCRRLTGVDWWLTGSAALAVRGIPVSPGDLDLVVSDEDAHRVGDLLLDELIVPVVPMEWFCRWFGRAVLGARVEWVGGVGPAADQPEVTDFGPVAASRLEVVPWQGFSVRVPPLDLQRAVSLRRGLTDRVRHIDTQQRTPAPHSHPSSPTP